MFFLLKPYQNKSKHIKKPSVMMTFLYIPYDFSLFNSENMLHFLLFHSNYPKIFFCIYFICTSQQKFPNLLPPDI